MADVRPYLEELCEDIKAEIIKKLREEEPLTITAVSVRAHLHWREPQRSGL